MNKITIHQGHVLEVLVKMPDESVQCIITSPPYWGLRDYGIDPVIWPAISYSPLPGLPPVEIPGDLGCVHGWGDLQPNPMKPYGNQVPQSKYTNSASADGQNAKAGQFCLKCGAWRGRLGLEPTIEMYVGHMVLICRELRRVLRKDGVFFLNIADSYASGKGSCFNPGGGESSYKDCRKESGVLPLNRQNKSDLNRQGLKPKDLCGVPWRLALALQADGWWLRSDIIWAKANPLPESVTDRPTKSHEYVFLLTKSPKYFWDADAVRQEHQEPWRSGKKEEMWSKKVNNDEQLICGGFGRGKYTHRIYNPAGRNLRTVWNINTQGFPEAHFATFPEKLVEPMIKAGTSERGCCPSCGAPWVRVVEKKAATMNIRVRDAKKGIIDQKYIGESATEAEVANYGKEEMGQTRTLGWRPSCGCVTEAMKRAGCNKDGAYHGQAQKEYNSVKAQNPSDTKRRILESMANPKQTIGWEASCECEELKPIPCVVLDPFFGAGTSGLVAAKLGRDCIGIEIKPEYVEIAAKRLKSALGLLAEVEVE